MLRPCTAVTVGWVVYPGWYRWVYTGWCIPRVHRVVHTRVYLSLHHPGYTLPTHTLGIPLPTHPGYTPPGIYTPVTPWVCTTCYTPLLHPGYAPPWVYPTWYIHHCLNLGYTSVLERYVAQSGARSSWKRGGNDAQSVPVLPVEEGRMMRREVPVLPVYSEG